MDNARIARAFRQMLPLTTVFVATACVAWLAYGFRYIPVLHSDDWTHIVGQYVYGSLKWLDWSNRRPLLDAPLIMVTGLFGLNTRAIYVVVIALQVLAALQLYGLVRRTGAGSRSFALLVSLIFLVYPADYTHTWLTMIGGWVAMNLLLVYAHLLLSYATRGDGWLLVASNAVLLVSLGIYEAQLGLALAWALLLLFFTKDASRARRVALLTPLAIGLFFLVWRTLGVPAMGVTDPYIQRLQFGPLGILYRAAFGLGILIWSWAVTLRAALQFDSKLLLIGLAALVVGLFVLIGFALARALRRDSQPLTKTQRNARARKALALFVLGGILAIAGYLPIVSVYLPSLSGAASRFNLFAIPGASLAIVALLWLIALLLGRGDAQVQLIMIISALPLLLIGIWTQAWVRYDATTVWQEQKRIWTDFATKVPNLDDDTVVYFVLSGYQNRPRIHNWHRTPLTAPWEVTSALQVLYDKPSLQGDLMLLNDNPRFRRSALHSNGVFDYLTQETLPYERTVFVAFDGDSQAIRIIEDLRTELSLPWTPLGYAPQSRITAQPIDGFTHRWLVGLPAPPN